MTQFEFCIKVKASLGGEWPYPGALADASEFYKKMYDVPTAVTKIKNRAEVYAPKKRK